MRRTAEVAILTASVGLPAFLWSAGSPAGGWWHLWPWPDAGTPAAPEGVAFVLAAGAGLAEAVALGLAVSFLAWGWPIVAQHAPSRRAAAGLYASLAWMLGSWWIHDNLHFVNGMNTMGLIVIVYAFHISLLAAAAFVCLALVRPPGGIFRTPAPTPPAPSGARARKP